MCLLQILLINFIYFYLLMCVYAQEFVCMCTTYLQYLWDQKKVMNSMQFQSQAVTSSPI